ncbi:GntR family transcriptional regulator [Aneurinibacillus sp. Ricciae_BoGa-3]|uniref:GntR family transcriptional regulator n=1 Tax=Aneurinibacillus sp. Ricciae_BoGa-3 TaxID=3022697 RepID=UPI0023406D4B|nr:GntR family transcriptional regulator [Aneurinibacillus sp. Ricciae_BoGa-3]WCK56408.1 GntR family transcriptional regulator [Aneurinibacillus sp. Ricciae_BoGa-3]
MKHSIVNKSLSAQIYESLRDQIIKGELQPGDRIVELEVAKNFGVSQAPVREAFLKLADEELVVSQRNKGTVVSNISTDEMDELYGFRLMMEEMAIKRAFERMTEEDVKILEDFYHEMVQAGENNDLDSLRIADVNFHSKIYDMADHKFMRSVWDTLVSKLNRIWYLTSQMYFTHLSEVASIHEPIVKSFRADDLNGCIKAFVNHVNYEKKMSGLRAIN